jgi:hypothetical protein
MCFYLRILQVKDSVGLGHLTYNTFCRMCSILGVQPNYNMLPLARLCLDWRREVGGSKAQASKCPAGSRRTVGSHRVRAERTVGRLSTERPANQAVRKEPRQDAL